MSLKDQYPWAVNPLKLERAVAYVKSFGPITEQAVKARYLALSGALHHVQASDSPADNVPANVPIDSPTAKPVEPQKLSDPADVSVAKKTRKKK